MDSLTESGRRESEVESDYYDFGEAIEDYEESIFAEPVVRSCVTDTQVSDTSDSESQATSEESYETKRANAMKMKWMTVAGRKPLSLPLTMIYQPKRDESERGEVITRFGERRPLFIEEKRKENWLKLKMNKETVHSYVNLGRVLMEIRLMERWWGLRCLRFSPTDDTMAISFGNGTVQIRNANSGALLNTLNTIERLYKLGIPALRFHPKIIDRLYVGGAAGVIQLYDTKNPKSIATINEKLNEICNLDISSDGSLLISVGKDGNVYLYDAMSLRPVSVQRKPGINEITSETDLSYHSMRIFGLKCHPENPNLFVTGGWDCTAKVWDTRVCGAVHSMYGPMICGDSVDVRKNEILTGSWTATNSLKLWDLTSGRILRNIIIRNGSSPIEGDFIYVARFFTGLKNVDAIITGGNGTDEVQVIDIKNEMALVNFPALKAVTALDSNGDVIAYGGMESILRFADLKNDQSLSLPIKK